VLDIKCDDSEYVYVSDPFLVVSPSGRKLIVRAYEKYEYCPSVEPDELTDYYEEILDRDPSTERAAQVFKYRIKKPRVTQLDWGYDNIDLLPKGNVVRKRPDWNPSFSRESIYG